MSDPVLSVRPLGFPWETADPFLFCVYHNDAYPVGNEALGPAASLVGRNLGSDFEGIDGWRMYHGRKVPGFPGHPHRGFETVTVVRKGLIDHSDSLGATARFGGGDTQWLTAGKGIVHSEMFPLVKRDAPNPLELFQIWLNLPKADKFVEPHFTMLWADEIPTVHADGTDVTVIAGRYADAAPPPPPPKSWASRPESDVAIWTVKLAPGAQWKPPKTLGTTNRTLYVFAGKVTIAGRAIPMKSGVRVRADADVTVVNGDTTAELLVLQGRPIGEPVVSHGPFVMNDVAGIRQAFDDYHRTQFGGWPWPSEAPVHPREAGRFAKHVDGRVEQRG